MSQTAPAPADHPDRLVVLDAVHNFRDLGGYPAADGRSTRWRVLFRADGLYRLTGADLDALRPLGLRTVVDLRTPAELDERGRFPHEAHPVTYHHLSVIDATWDIGDRASAPTDAEFLLGAYRRMLAAGQDRFAEAIRRLAAPGALPAVFHCAAGKDRTGILAALLLGALGVDRGHIVADYALTAAGMERLKAWAARQDPEVAGRMAETPAAFLAAVPEAMAQLVTELTDQFGTLRDYVRAIGITDGELARLEADLLTE